MIRLHVGPYWTAAMFWYVSFAAEQSSPAGAASVHAMEPVARSYPTILLISCFTTSLSVNQMPGIRLRLSFLATVSAGLSHANCSSPECGDSVGPFCPLAVGFGF